MTRQLPGAAMPQRLAALGPFFAIDCHDDGPVLPPWRPMAELLDDTAVLRERVAGVRTYLAAAGGQPLEAVEERVAASVTHLGLAARLVSPAFAVAVLDGAVLRYGLREARWQPVPGGMFPLSLPQQALEPVADQVELADRLGADLLDGPVRELSEALGAGFGVSARILHGNVASAVSGAAAAIARSAPQLAPGARELVAQLLARAPLQGAGTAADDGTGFRRRSCCLIYRAAPDHAGALCGDCVLTAPPGRQG